MEIRLNRKLHIYNATRDVDIDTGIEENSVSLSEVLISEDGIKFGSYNSSKFEATIYDAQFSVQDRIQVYFEAVGAAAIAGEAIAGIAIVGTDESDIGRDYLFTGRIESIKTDNFGYSKHIVAYDDLYWLKDIDTYSWLDIYFTEDDWYYFDGLIEDFIAVNLRFSAGYTLEYILPDLSDTPFEYYLWHPGGWRVHHPTIPHYSFAQLFSFICEAYLLFPHFNSRGVLEFMSFRQSTEHDIRDRYEKGESEFDEDSIAPIETVAISNNGIVVDSVSVGSGSTYVISDNFLINEIPVSDGMSGPDLSTTAFLTKYLNYMQQHEIHESYRPASIKMIWSDLDIHIGDKIITDKGSTRVFSRELSGPLLVDQTLVAQGGSGYSGPSSFTPSSSSPSFIPSSSASLTSQSFTRTSFVNITGPSGVFTQLGAFTLPSGVWMIVVNFQYAEVSEPTSTPVGRFQINLTCGTGTSRQQFGTQVGPGLSYNFGQLIGVYNTSTAGTSCTVSACLPDSGDVRADMQLTYIGQPQ